MRLLTTLRIPLNGNRERHSLAMTVRNEEVDMQSVGECRYLGSYMSKDLTIEKEISPRIEQQQQRVKH